MKRSLTIIVAVVFTCLFGILYIQVFSNLSYQPVSATTTTLYYLQVGVFAKEANAQKRLAELKTLRLAGYQFEKNQQFYVICGMSLNEEEQQKSKQILDEAGFGSYDKKIVITDQTVLQKWQKQEIEAILEWLSKE